VLGVGVHRLRSQGSSQSGSSISNGVGAPSGSCSNGSIYIDSNTGYIWTCKGSTWQLGSTFGILTGTTSSIGGGALLVGASASGTATVTGATTGMVCDAQASDGTNMSALGAAVFCTVTASNTVTVNVVAIIALTPSSKTYNVRVIP
jgi:hypothetical protein